MVNWVVKMELLKVSETAPRYFCIMFGLCFVSSYLGGIRGTVVARWTARQQVELSDWSCTRGMIHNKIHLIRQGSIALTVQNRSLKHQSFIHANI